MNRLEHSLKEFVGKKKGCEEYEIVSWTMR